MHFRNNALTLTRGADKFRTKTGYVRHNENLGTHASVGSNRIVDNRLMCLTSILTPLCLEITFTRQTLEVVEFY